MEQAAPPAAGVDLSPAATDLGRVHLLPCGIRHNSAAAVSDYFKPTDTGVEVDGVRVEEAFFRGRKLQGATVALPDGYRVNRAKKLPLKVWISVGNGSIEKECVKYAWNFPTFDKGYVLEKKNGEKDTQGMDGEVSNFVSRAEFQNITYWNHDTMPSAEDPLPRCFHWLTIANAMHKPVTAEDMANMSAMQNQKS